MLQEETLENPGTARVFVDWALLSCSTELHRSRPSTGTSTVLRSGTSDAGKGRELLAERALRVS
jgi:hypothetical protein